MTKPRRPNGLPSRQEIVEFIAASPFPVGKREIAKAFKVKPADRVALKGLLKDIERSGPVERTQRRRLAPAGALPEVAVVELYEIDAGGDAWCRPLGDMPDPPRIRLDKGALGLNERAVVRLSRLEGGQYSAALIRKLEPQGDRVLGVFTAGRDGGGRLTPTDRKHKTIYTVRPTEAMGCQDGELVLAAALPLPRLGLPHAQIVERLGKIGDPGSISLVAIHTQGIPTGFSAEAIAEAEAAKPVTLGTRTDLRQIPLVTIDGADARDFDDAVWAEPDADPDNPGGWHILVAIADVSWYVRPGSPLDRAAAERGNSVYFPDRVVPMLPEALSNELCSLKPEVERACLAIHMWLDADGTKLRHEVVRGLMRSAARFTYEQVQEMMDGPPGALRDLLVVPLYGAYQALDRARRKRGTLELDLPERKVVLAPDGTVASIERRLRLDSHKLIEEFMIAANVAAAETLEKVKRPCMYRVHDVPDPDKLDALREFLDGIGIHGLKLSKGQAVKPHHFGQILSAAVGRPEAPLINELVLRSQAQAVYSPENLGHFGLALRRYAHFTSPIRRYADLLVHRALVAGLKLGEGGLDPIAPEDFAELGAHISRTERRAALAERMAVDRYTIAFMQSHVGASFPGRINGVARFGLFVTLDDTGADGLVPIGSLPGDYYHHDANQHCLIGQRTRRTFTLGDRVEVKLVEADPIAGGMVFALLHAEGGAVKAHQPTPLRAQRGRAPPKRRRG
ncbi:MAG TPA: ribonuclease R [Aliidongia sp.]|nr:ribonuclease R [Aliidongia sp.]